MRIYHGFDHLPQFLTPSAAVGSFDGVHSGHKVLLDTLISTARASDGESIVLTFEPHPRVTLGRAQGLRLLTSTEEKARLLEQAGIDCLIVIPFDEAFSRLTPYDFVRRYLIEKVGVANLVVGYNHHFGHDKEGNYDYLDALCEELGLHVTHVGEYNGGNAKVSSTVIRKLIEQGEMACAARMMPHPYFLIGEYDGTAIRITEPLKLLPPPGSYPVLANGIPARLTIGMDGLLCTDLQLPQEKIMVTFES